jgi:hypothetical protein
MEFFTGDYAPNGKIARRILAVCPDGSDCQINLPLKSSPMPSADAPVKPTWT